MTPIELGYRKCRWCGCERRGDATRLIDEGWECLDVAWCEAEHARQRLPTREQMLVRYSELRFTETGWDANGAPTGIDANGDAA